MDLLKIIEQFEPRVQTILYNAYKLSGNYSNFLEILKYYKNKDLDTNVYIADNLDDDRSYYSKMDLSIHLSQRDSNNTVVFFHELTHLLHHRQLGFRVPKKFGEIKSDIISDESKMNDFVDYMNYLSESKGKRNEKLTYKLKKNNEIKIDDSQEVMDRDDIEYRCISCLEDIVDSIYDGRSYDRGLCYIKDNNSLPKKTRKSAGHGSEYFEIQDYDFLEIIANYAAISIMAPDLEEFSILKEIMGEEMTDLLDEQLGRIYDDPIRSQYMSEDNTKFSIKEIVKLAIKKDEITLKDIKNANGVEQNRNDRFK